MAFMDTKTSYAASFPCILVDYEQARRFPKYNQWLKEKQTDDCHVEIVMLVTNPKVNDYTQTSTDIDFEPTVVLRNSGSLPHIIFKTNALLAVQEISNLLPVIAWDNNLRVMDVYRAGGVPITDELSYLFVGDN